MELYGALGRDETSRLTCFSKDAKRGLRRDVVFEIRCGVELLTFTHIVKLVKLCRSHGRLIKDTATIIISTSTS